MGLVVSFSAWVQYPAEKRYWIYIIFTVEHGNLPDNPNTFGGRVKIVRRIQLEGDEVIWGAQEDYNMNLILKLIELKL